MADTTYGPKVYQKQGSDELVVADGGTITVESGGIINVESGGLVKDDGTQASAITGLTITYTANDPSITADGAVTVADGDAPTVVELLELVEELKAQNVALIAALVGAGVLAAS